MTSRRSGFFAPGMVNFPSSSPALENRTIGAETPSREVSTKLRERCSRPRGLRAAALRTEWLGGAVVGLAIIAASCDYESLAIPPPPPGSWSTVIARDAPWPRYAHTAVWTGEEMIVTGGGVGPSGKGSWGWRAEWKGGRYDPGLDAWLLIEDEGRTWQRAVWTGSEMIVWGGQGCKSCSGPGGARYDPGTDAWEPMTTDGAPLLVDEPGAVWTGSEMIVWGGSDRFDSVFVVGAGGRYSPDTDAWAPVAADGAPEARSGHTAVWTGTEMIVWGGFGALGENGRSTLFDSGARYDPQTDTWTPVSTAGAPEARTGHTAVWTGTEMIVWGGLHGSLGPYYGNGGRYDPETDTWTPVSTVGAPVERSRHTAVWTGAEMIVWGGQSPDEGLANGGRYDPLRDAWAPLPELGREQARMWHTAVWTGEEMIVWGGVGYDGEFDTGLRYAP